MPQWQADHNDSEARDTLRRAFHTLKGSGRMVGATDIGEVAWSVENLLNKIIEGAQPLLAEHIQLAADVAEFVPSMVSAFENRTGFDRAKAEALIAKAEAYASGDKAAADAVCVDSSEDKVVEAIAEEPTEFTDTAEAEAEIPVLEESDIPTLELVDASEPTDSEDEVLELAEVEPQATTDDEDIDQELLEIFAGEAATHKETLDQFIAHCQELAGPAELTDDLQRALHTLKGSANMAGIMPVAMIVGPVEGFIKDLRAMQMKADGSIVELLEKTSEYIQQGADQLATTPLQTLSGADAFLEALNNLHKERLAAAADADAEDNTLPPEALNQFLTLSLDVVDEASALLPQWQTGGLAEQKKQAVVDSFAHMIEQGEPINVPAYIELAQAMQVFYRQALEAGEQRQAFTDLAQQGNDALIDMLDQIAGHQVPAFDTSLLAEIEAFEIQTVAVEQPLASPIGCSPPIMPTYE